MEIRSSKLNSCPECGGLFVNDLSCYDQLLQLFILEAQDAKLQAEHFLTVASYNLQHPSKFTDDAIIGLQSVFKDYLDEKATIQMVRNRVSEASNGSTPVIKPVEERVIKPRSWSKTMSDVYIPFSPQDTAERVRVWAEAIKADLSD